MKTVGWILAAVAAAVVLLILWQKSANAQEAIGGSGPLEPPNPKTTGPIVAPPAAAQPGWQPGNTAPNFGPPGVYPTPVGNVKPTPSGGLMNGNIVKDAKPYTMGGVVNVVTNPVAHLPGEWGNRANIATNPIKQLSLITGLFR
jgi:hypothetical protein